MLLCIPHFVVSISGPRLKHADGGPRAGQKGAQEAAATQQYDRGSKRGGGGTECFLATVQRMNTRIAKHKKGENLQTAHQ